MNASNHGADGMDGSDLEPADAALLADLAVLLRGHSEPPEEVLHAAREIFTWRTVDAEIAALAYDSLLDDDLALARSHGQPRILTFEAEGVTIEVEIDVTAGRRRLLGQLVPAQAAELELRGAGDPITGTADDLGRFAMPLPAARTRVSLRCRLANGQQAESATAVL